MAIAQTTTVTGKVTDNKNLALPGVTVLVKGTTQSTNTNAEGQYSIAVPAGASLIFSYIGFTSQTVAVGGQSVLNLALAPDTKALDEVVVTALNVSRERKTLGYSVTEIQGSSLTQAREPNLTNTLVGRVAGLNVNSTSGGAGASTNIIIRGASSLNQTNQPLYVINGVPVESQPSNNNPGGQYDNGPDPGRRHFQYQPRRYCHHLGAEGRGGLGPVRLPGQGRRYPHHHQKRQGQRRRGF
ncbi:MAG: carboxypeptidase-like regulatory domain-containing protein [Hymenobacter sp.]